MAKMHTPIPELKLNDGHSIPMLAFGTGTAWYKQGDESQIDRSLVDSIKKAINMGYTHLDGAQVYKTESELGMAIKESGVDRKDLFITSKIMCDSADEIPEAIDISLKKLGVDHLDLYLIHAPFFAKSDEDLRKAWAHMEQIQASGKSKSIGVSNFQPEHFKALEKTQKVVPAINQVEFHPYLQQPELLNYHKEHGIATAAYSPLTPITKANPGPVDAFWGSLSKKYACNPGEIALRWAIDQDVVAVTTSSNEQRMSDMLRVTKFKLTPAEIKTTNEQGEEKHFRGFFSAKFK